MTTKNSSGSKNNPDIDLTAPAWDLSIEYPGFESVKFKKDFDRLVEIVFALKNLGKSVEPFLNENGMDDAAFAQALPNTQKMQELSSKGSVLLSDLSAYTSCFLAVDGTNTEAKKINSRLQELGANLDESLVPLTYLLATISEDQLQQFLKNPIAANGRFQIEKSREHSYRRVLPPGEEKLLASLSPLGLHAWWNQYEGIATATNVKIGDGTNAKIVGLSQTSTYLSSPDREVRRIAWEAVNAAWESQREAAAAGINALAGWRIKEDSMRSRHRPKHFIDDALHSSRVEADTIDTMMLTLRKNAHVGQRALKLIALILGGETYEPWDKFAPLPAQFAMARDEKIPFSHALSELRDAFNNFHSELGDFVTLCAEKNWIEARSLSTKRPGAFSHGFTGSGEPRTFLSWSGTKDDARTFAHETGHSHHTYVLRDLPPEQRNYPMTLAETASNIGEMLYSDFESTKAKSPQDTLALLWEEMQTSTAYLINIPLRYDFEVELYKRRQKDFVTADELDDIMHEMHRRWYGGVMSKPEKLFWASKQHFHFSGISFYNFPYSFGFLFASSIHSLIKEQGQSFYPNYVALLRDTGRMTAEDIAKKHLNVDLGDEEFWQRGCDHFAAKVSQFESALKTAGVIISF